MQPSGFRCGHRAGIAALAILACSTLPWLLGSNRAGAQEKETRPVIGEMIVQTIPAKRYVHGAFETNFKSIGEPVGKTLGALIQAARQNKIAYLGPGVHVYHGAPHRAPDKDFKMESGFIIRDQIESVGDFKVRELPTFHCASMLYVGTVPRIGDAWQKIYREIQSRELTPTDDERELVLYFEALDSPNNIVQVQVGLKGPQGKASSN